MDKFHFFLYLKVFENVRIFGHRKFLIQTNLDLRYDYNMSGYSGNENEENN